MSGEEILATMGKPNSVAVAAASSALVQTFSGSMGRPAAASTFLAAASVETSPRGCAERPADEGEYSAWWRRASWRAPARASTAREGSANVGMPCASSAAATSVVASITITMARSGNFFLSAISSSLVDWKRLGDRPTWARYAKTVP